MPNEAQPTRVHMPSARDLSVEATVLEFLLRELLARLPERPELFAPDLPHRDALLTQEELAREADKLRERVDQLRQQAQTRRAGSSR